MTGVLFSTPHKMELERNATLLQSIHRRANTNTNTTASSSSVVDPLQLESLSSALRNVDLDQVRALKLAQMYAQMKAINSSASTANQHQRIAKSKVQSPSGLASSPLISSTLLSLRSAASNQNSSSTTSTTTNNQSNLRRSSSAFSSPNPYPAGHIVLPNKPRPNSANSTPTTCARLSDYLTTNMNADNRMRLTTTTANSMNHSGKNQVKPNKSNNHQELEQPVLWRVAIDPKTKRPYYYHPITRQTTWKKPKELVEKEKREKAQFFSAMEQNILNKLHGSMGPATTTSPTNSVKSEEPAMASPSGSATVSPNQPATSSVAEPVEQPTRLFRTLSSCDGSLSWDLHKGGKIYVSTFPSPIHEGKESLVPSSPATTTCSSMPVVDSAPTKSVASDSMQNQTLLASRIPLRRRSNSTSTIFVRMGTMNAPDQDLSIQCVATVLRSHLLDAMETPITNDKCFDLLQFRNGGNQKLVETTMPTLDDIATFMRFVYTRAQMESECIIMSLIYVERLLKATSGRLQLQPGNWRTILFCSMIMASKVWDDLSMCNADFVKIWPDLTLKEINDLELLYLGSVEYNVRVSAVSYAKYYFHLRSICASMGQLAAFDESAPLNLDAARKMQVISEEYQERSKLSPCLRRRSVTITSPNEQRKASAVSGSARKTSPSASLEQIVRMQVSQAGGSMLGRSMGRSTP